MSTQMATQDIETLEGKVEATIAAVQMLIAVACQDEGTRVLLKRLLRIFQNHEGYGNDAFKATLDKYLDYAEMADG